MLVPDKCPGCGGYIQKMGSSTFKVDESKCDIFCGEAEACFYFNKRANTISWQIMPKFDILVDLNKGSCLFFQIPESDVSFKKGSFRRAASEGAENEVAEFAFQLHKNSLNNIEEMFLQIANCDFVIHPEQHKLEVFIL